LSDASAAASPGKVTVGADETAVRRRRGSSTSRTPLLHGSRRGPQTNRKRIERQRNSDFAFPGESLDQDKQYPINNILETVTPSDFY
jgi:hypothetical protein